MSQTQIEKKDLNQINNIKLNKTQQVLQNTKQNQSALLPQNNKPKIQSNK